MSSIQNVLGSAKRSGDAVLQTRDYLNKAAMLDGQLSQRNAAYGKASSRVKSSKFGVAVNKSVPIQNKVFGYASDVVTVAGLGLSGIALPEMAKKTADSARQLAGMFDDPNATTAQKLDTVETLTRSAAGTIFSAQGVYLGAKGTASIISRFKPIGNLFAKLGDAKFLGFMKTNPVGRALGALLPIADGAVFIGEAIATNRTFKDPLATPEQKARKVLDLGLAGIKTAFWLLPGARFLKTAYSAASYGQLGLTLWDFRKTLGPKIVSAVKTLGWGITHPKEGLAALGSAIKNVAVGAFTKTGSALAWLFQRVAHPVETWTTLVKGAHAVNETVKSAPSATPGPLDQGPAAPVPTGPVNPDVFAPQQPVAQPQVPVTPVANTPAMPVVEMPAAPVVEMPVTPVTPAAPVAPVTPVMPETPVAPVVTAPVTEPTPAVVPAPVAVAPVADAGTDAAYQDAMAQLGGTP
jgi:hypothetical protein